MITKIKYFNVVVIKLKFQVIKFSFLKKMGSLVELIKSQNDLQRILVKN